VIEAVGEAGWMKPSQLIPSAEVERMMKLQDVLLKANDHDDYGDRR
jgi:hypothetical protein